MFLTIKNNSNIALCQFSTGVFLCFLSLSSLHHLESHSQWLLPSLPQKMAKWDILVYSTTATSCLSLKSKANLTAIPMRHLSEEQGRLPQIQISEHQLLSFLIRNLLVGTGFLWRREVVRILSLLLASDPFL